MKKWIKIFLVSALVFTSCEKLEVENTNNPDRTKILSNMRDFKNFAQNIYLTYWQAIRGNPSTSLHIGSLVAADQFTASWLNFACYDLSIEPRKAWTNNVAYEYHIQVYGFYSGMYTVLYMSNTLIDKLNNGEKLDADSSKNMGYLSMAYFMQGLALGQLGITFDKAQIITENTDIEKSAVFSRYDVVIDSAVAALDKAAELAKKYNFDLGSNIINGTNFTSDLVYKASHSFAARFMVLGARSATENNQTNWKKVMSYTQPGKSLDHDFGPQGDGGEKWTDEIMPWLTNVDNTSLFYAKIDNRLIHLLDPAYPSRYPKSGRPPRVHSDKRIGEAASRDLRLNSYFEYSNTIKFLPERGTYHYSHYRFKRFDNIRKTQRGHFVELSAYENHLMYIESLVMNKVTSTPSIPTMVNALGPRKYAGGLANIPDNSDSRVILETLFYEREVELLGQVYLMGFCDMRRRNMLQKGTPLHFPVPALELQTLNIKDITVFGGEENADGINTSNEGWNKN